MLSCTDREEDRVRRGLSLEGETMESPRSHHLWQHWCPNSQPPTNSHVCSRVGPLSMEAPPSLGWLPSHTALTASLPSQPLLSAYNRDAQMHVILTEPSASSEETVPQQLRKEDSRQPSNFLLDCGNFHVCLILHGATGNACCSWCPCFQAPCSRAAAAAACPQQMATWSQAHCISQVLRHFTCTWNGRHFTEQWFLINRISLELLVI